MPQYTILFYLSILIVLSSCRSLPTGKETGGDELARKVMKATGVSNWDTTGVVAFTFANRKHLWDKKRELVWIRWGDIEVMESLKTKQGKVWKNGKLLSGKKQNKYLNKAWKAWINDSFWFYPFFKFFDEGTTRKVVKREGETDALLISYSKGGVTPGDSYLWILDEEGLPVAWQLWVKIIPVKGFRVSWESWQELPVGIKVSTLHKSKLMSIRISDVRAAYSIKELFPEGDPFERM